MTIDECIKAIERDRHEPDKVLLNVASLRRAVGDVAAVCDDGETVWRKLYIDRRDVASSEETR